MDVMCTKHLEKCPLSAAILESYPSLSSELVPVDMTEDTEPDIAGSFSEGSGLGGVGLIEPTTMAPPIWVGEQGAEADGGGLHGKYCKWVTSLGRLQ